MRRTAVRAAAALDRLLTGLAATILAVPRAIVFAATLALAVGGMGRIRELIAL
jgi:hypothetical protein